MPEGTLVATKFSVSVLAKKEYMPPYAPKAADPIPPEGAPNELVSPDIAMDAEPVEPESEKSVEGRKFPP
jgi:hypothetical protein